MRVSECVWVCACMRACVDCSLGSGVAASEVLTVCSLGSGVAMSQVLNVAWFAICQKFTLVQGCLVRSVDCTLVQGCRVRSVDCTLVWVSVSEVLTIACFASCRDISVDRSLVRELPPCHKC